jgi:hypothetical protein
MQDPGHRNRVALGLTLAVVPVIVGVEIGVVVHSWSAGIAIGGGIILFWIALIVAVRRQAKSEIARERSTALPSMRGVLEFSSLPGEWPSLARETLPAAGADRARGLGVTVVAEGGWLRLVKRTGRGAGRHPFEAQVPLAAVVDVRSGKARIGLIGSSVSFVLADGKELVLDTAHDTNHAAELAQRFGDAAGRARLAPLPGSPELVVTTPPPPSRTSPGLSAVLIMATFAPFVIAMAGAPNGPFADVATLWLLFVALWTGMWRKPSLPRTIAKWSVAAGAAFALDAALTAQPPRLAGVAVCLLLARWMFSRGPTGLSGPTTVTA